MSKIFSSSRENAVKDQFHNRKNKHNFNFNSYQSQKIIYIIKNK